MATRTENFDFVLHCNFPSLLSISLPHPSPVTPPDANPGSQRACSFGALRIGAFENRAFSEMSARITPFGEFAQGLLHGLHRPHFLVNGRDLCLSPHSHLSPFRAGLYS